MAGSDMLENAVEARVATEAQSIFIAGAGKFAESFSILAKCQSALAAAKVQIGEGVINLRGLAVKVQRTLWIFAGLRIDSAVVKLIPARETGSGEVRAVHRSKGRAIL